MPPVSNPANTSAADSIELFGIRIHRLTLRTAAECILDWIDEAAESCRYVVTPNLDHVVQLRGCHPLRDAYKNAAMVVADGWPLVAASRWFDKPLPERVAGSDLVPTVCAEARGRLRPLTVYLLGAAEGVGGIAATKMQDDWPHLRVVGVDSPPRGFEHDPDQNQGILNRIRRASPDLLLVGLGAPKQETWLNHHRSRIAARVAVACGATIDFLAGVQRRAPKWMQRGGVEWLHRLASNPRRLALRYGRDVVALPALLWREWHLCRRPKRLADLNNTQESDLNP